MTKEAAAPQGAAEAKLILYGRDDAGKPHASWFAEADAELATKAAGMMGMAALPVTSDEARALALQLPAGRIFASGRAFSPFSKMVAYEALVALGGEPPQAAPKPQPVAPPDTAENELLPHATVPSTWSEISAQSLVLAPVGDTSWYPAVVDEVKGADLLVLRWQSWPDEPAFVRRREHVGLLQAPAVDPA